MISQGSPSVAIWSHHVLRKKGCICVLQLKNRVSLNFQQKKNRKKGREIWDSMEISDEYFDLKSLGHHPLSVE